MELPAPALPSFPEPAPGWRKAALVAGCIATVELIALVVVALAFIAKPFADDAPAKAGAKAAGGEQAAAQEEGGAGATVDVSSGSNSSAPAAERPRAKTGILVLNGNGLAGAASEKAAVVRSLRYPVRGVSDAARRNFPRTIVMYRAGFLGEAQRLARDLGMPRQRAVPLDGMRPAELAGAQLVLVVGNQP